MVTPSKRQRDAFTRRLLRSQDWPKRDDFKRRITKKSGGDSFHEKNEKKSGGRGGLGSSAAFERRILRSARQIMRTVTVTPLPELAVNKRQSLIPFPRTGKRSGESAQVYIYDEEEPEPEPLRKEEEVEIDEEDEEEDDEDSDFMLDDRDLGDDDAMFAFEDLLEGERLGRTMISSAWS